jgi:hypothetical protein
MEEMEETGDPDATAFAEAGDRKVSAVRKVKKEMLLILSRLAADYP